MRNLEFLTEIRNQKGTYWYMKQRHENLIIHLKNLEAHLEWTKTIHQDIVKYSLIPPIARNYINVRTHILVRWINYEPRTPVVIFWRIQRLCANVLTVWKPR